MAMERSMIWNWLKGFWEKPTHHAVRQAQKWGLSFSKDRIILERGRDLQVKEITIPDGVKEIGDRAFYRYHCVPICPPPEFALTRIVLQDSITKIGENAFRSCGQLTSINIPDGVTEIGKEAFRGCKNLTVIDIPPSVISIGEGAFCGVRKVRSDNPDFPVDQTGVLIDRKKHKLLFAPPSISGNYSIPDGITEIGGHAFHECRSLSGLEISQSVEKMGNHAFCSCSGLTDLVIHDGVREIGDLAFSGCAGLTSVVIPGSVRKIGRGAFFICENLTKIDIRDGVTTIEDLAFSQCPKLAKVTIPNSVSEFNEFAFSMTDCEEQVRRDYPHLFEDN